MKMVESTATIEPMITTVILKTLNGFMDLA